jgi:CubicO group peptidase (beta-lactamase class C family)
MGAAIDKQPKQDYCVCYNTTQRNHFMPNQLPRSAPEAQGISSSAILNFVEAVEKNVNEFHSFMLLRHGHVVAEGWWSPHAPDRPHMLFSLSKSFTSSAIGLAVAEGHLTVEDKVISFFPDDLPAEISDNLAAMRVHDLLAMATGHHEDTTSFMRERQDGNWTRAFLERPVEHTPGTYFVYNSGATFMLSAIIQKITGMRLLDYLQPRLLQPLGVEGATWQQSPQGIDTGGWGLTIKTEDIANFGQLYLQKGQWQGKQILSESWISAATSKQVSNGGNPERDWEQGYGYQFWRCRHNAYRGDGAFGQYCLVMPDQDAVLAITSGLGDMQPPLNLVWEHLLPALNNPAPLPADDDACEKLKRKLASLAYAPPQGQKSSPLAAKISGKTYALEPNESKFEALSFDFAESDSIITFRAENGSFPIPCGIGEWREGSTTLFGEPSNIAASGVWTSDDTFLVTLRFYETPFVNTIPCRFEGDHLIIDASVNVSFGPTAYSLRGHTP